MRNFARRVDKVAGDGALGVPSAAALTAACETALDWQAKAQALERQLAEVLERERRAAEERKRVKQADLLGGGASDGGWDSASAASNEKVLYTHTIVCVCVCVCVCEYKTVYIYIERKGAVGTPRTDEEDEEQGCPA